MHAGAGTRDVLVNRHKRPCPRDKLIGWRLNCPTSVWRRPPPGFIICEELQETRPEAWKQL
jgi:hypothetical protein